MIINDMDILEYTTLIQYYHKDITYSIQLTLQLEFVIFIYELKICVNRIIPTIQYYFNKDTVII